MPLVSPDSQVTAARTASRRSQDAQEEVRAHTRLGDFILLSSCITAECPSPTIGRLSNDIQYLGPIPGSQTAKVFTKGCDACRTLTQTPSRMLACKQRPQLLRGQNMKKMLGYRGM